MCFHETMGVTRGCSASVMSFDAVEQQQRTKNVLVRVRVLREMLRDQKALWDKFRQETQNLSQQLHDCADHLTPNWHDSEALAMRISESYKRIDEVEEAIKALKT